jgi:preprotein translocase subunit SecG
MLVTTQGVALLSSMVPAPFLALGLLNVFWGLLAFLLVFLCLFLIAIILIQDPKGGGLSSAFGAGPGGDSILGAQAQKGVTRVTSVLFCILVAVTLAMVLIDNIWLSQASSGTALPPSQEASAVDGTGPEDAPGPLGEETGEITPPSTVPEGASTPETPPSEPPAEPSGSGDNK